MFQRWTNLAFLHWPVLASDLSPFVPAGWELDLYLNRAWLGVSPFTIEGARPRGLPPLPGASSFPELNVRTYVRVNGVPGVMFFSLDAGSRIAVEGARIAYGLPYLYANMRSRTQGDVTTYQSTRLDTRGPAASFEARYAPLGPVLRHVPGSLEHWLTERYYLFAHSQGRTWRAGIHHLPWPLQDATATIATNGMVTAAGIPLDHAEPLVHYAKRLDVLIWPPQHVS